MCVLKNNLNSVVNNKDGGSKMYFKRLKDLREDHDYKQKDIANLLDISQQYYSQYELGKYTMPIELLIKLAKYYNVSLDYLVGLTNSKDPK